MFYNFESPSDEKTDEFYMRQAFKEAERAFSLGEVPVGAVVVCGGKIISRAHNLTERLNDVTAHAEIQAITAAAEFLGGKYLDECTLYVTLEPCVMCAGASYWAQLGRVVFGAYDSHRGFSRLNPSPLHPKTICAGRVLEEECSQLIKSFFKNKRG